MRRSEVMGRDTLALLLDYYGDLLTEKQRTYCDLCYNQDFSLAEIAEQTGISRQGVHDSLLHAEAALREFEQILGCAARDGKTREAISQAEAELAHLLHHADSQVRTSAQRVLDALQTIRE